MSGQESKGRRHAYSGTTLAASLEKSLSAYAAAAAAAGVSLLALAVPAEARIVYTPANTSIPVNGGPVPLDLNHDGTADFSFVNSRWVGSDHGEFIDWLTALPKEPGNQVWGRGSFSIGRPLHGPKSSYRSVFASALGASVKVRSNRSYFQKNGGRWLMASYGGSVYRSGSVGQWLYTKNRYLGLKFMIDGQTHYGWARLNVTLSSQIIYGIQASLTGYAYETIPNKPIITGKTKGPDVITLEPATLGRLAQGASGISAWREKK